MNTYVTLDNSLKHEGIIVTKKTWYKIFIPSKKVICQDPRWTGFFGWLFSLGRKLQIEVHGDYFSQSNWFRKWIIKKADKVRVVNPIIKNQLKQIGIKNIEVRPIKIPKFKLKGKSIKCGLLYVGRLEKEKGVYDLLKIKQKLTIVGTGKEEKKSELSLLRY